MMCRMCDEKIRLDKYGYWIHTADGEGHCRKHPAAIATPDYDEELEEARYWAEHGG